YDFPPKQHLRSFLQVNLAIPARFPLADCYYILFAGFANYQRGQRIMIMMVFLDSFHTVICIAVITPIFTRVISAYIDTCHAAAFRALVSVFSHNKLDAKQSFKPFFIHTTGALNPKPVKVEIFRTGIEG